MKGQHQPQEEQLAVARLIGLGGIAERRRHDREPVILQPPRRKDQVVADAVVERERRLDKADGHDEREHRQHDHRDMDRQAWARDFRLGAAAHGKGDGGRHGKGRQVGRRPEKAEAAEEESDQNDQREADRGRPEDGLAEPGRGEQGTSEPPRRKHRQRREEPEHETRAEGKAEEPAQPQLGDCQRGHSRGDSSPHERRC